MDHVWVVMFSWGTYAVCGNIKETPNLIPAQIGLDPLHVVLRTDRQGGDINNL